MKGVMGIDEKSFPLSLFFLPITFHLHSALVPIISHTSRLSPWARSLWRRLGKLPL